MGVTKNLDLIEVCRFGVHDISRIERDAVNDLPRFNMPFELGLFLGARRFGKGDQRRKLCLVLEAERYRYQKFLSDIAGQAFASTTTSRARRSAQCATGSQRRDRKPHLPCLGLRRS